MSACGICHYDNDNVQLDVWYVVLICPVIGCAVGYTCEHRNNEYVTWCV